MATNVTSCIITTTKVMEGASSRRQYARQGQNCARESATATAEELPLTASRPDHFCDGKKRSPTRWPCYVAVLIMSIWTVFNCLCIYIYTCASCCEINQYKLREQSSSTGDDRRLSSPAIRRSRCLINEYPHNSIGLYRDVWIAAIAWSRTRVTTLESCLPWK